MNQHSTFRYQVDGMHCGSCVARVEKALAGVPGVGSAFRTTKLAVSVREQAYFLAALRSAISARTALPLAERSTFLVDLARTSWM